MNDNQTIYRILFNQGNDVYEIYSRYVCEETLMGFIEIEELVFPTAHANKSEKAKSNKSLDTLRQEFTNVKRCYVPVHSVLRIDEINQHITDQIQLSKPTNVHHLVSVGKRQPRREQD